MNFSFSKILILLSAAVILLIGSILIVTFNPDKQDKNGFVCGVESPTLVCGNVFTDPITRFSLVDSIPEEKYLRMVQGENLFNGSGCNTCHAIDKKVVGPALRNVTKRRTKKWLVAAIQNFNKLLKQKDNQALLLYEEYNKMQMPAHEFLTKSDVEKIILYIEYASKPHF